MDSIKEKKVAEEGAKDDVFFIEDSSSTESEGELKFSHQEHHRSCKQAGNSSPLLLLAFPRSSGRALQQHTTLAPTSDLEEQEEEEGEDSDQPIEEWMILGGDEQVEDSNIQLNLSYWNSSEDDSKDEDIPDEYVKSVKDAWAVSERDWYGADQSLASRYFVPGRSLICHICNRTGHLAKSCYLFKDKCPTCVLCGIRGHLQRYCPGRPCHRCGLPSHGLRPCEIPPVWNQHCQRCGMTGHLSDACPDTWRQYHLTIRLEVPLKPQTVLKHKRGHAHCYNCSKRGHYGYECTRRRMVSGTFPSLPYVCHYDTMDDILQCCTKMQKTAKELASVETLPPSDPEHLSEKTGESGKENGSVQGRSRTKQEACSLGGKRKTWPERRRERREVKRLRREAQAMREGGLLQRSRANFDDKVCPAHPFRNPIHSDRQSTPPAQKRRKETCGRKTRKSREAERWKKRGGIKRGDLYPHGDVEIGSENLFSPKQRVRHRRR